MPAHFVTVGGQAEGELAQFGSLLGKFPARNCVKVTQSLLGVFEAEKHPGEDFNACEWLAQADAYFYHKEYEQTVLAAYEAAAAVARVPLYRRLVDPFTSAEALWEFENLLLSSPADTLVILMGVKHLREIVGDLVAAGRSGETP